MDRTFRYRETLGEYEKEFEFPVDSIPREELNSFMEVFFKAVKKNFVEEEK